MIVLVLDAALDGCLAGVVSDTRLIAERREGGNRGSAAALPGLAAKVLEGVGNLDAVVVTVGPGSFTGVRAAVALAQGLGLAAGIPVIGVTVGEAIRAEAPRQRSVWVAVDSRRGQVFLDDGTAVVTTALEALPTPTGAIAVGGDAAILVGCRLAAAGVDVLLLDVRRPGSLGIAAAGTRSIRAAVPLYVDGVEARTNPGHRPTPV